MHVRSPSGGRASPRPPADQVCVSGQVGEKNERPVRHRAADCCPARLSTQRSLRLARSEGAFPEAFQ
eukprot:6061487-Prymnesium_polylepis.1